MKAISDIDWSKQHCGVHHAPIDAVKLLMPDLEMVLDTFPDNPKNFTWDVKIHMLMPRQYPCIPNWHRDNVPRVGGIQRFDLCKFDLPMYLWLSGGPLTQFKHGYVVANEWVRFSQADEHRGTAASDFCWRAFIRASHSDILTIKKVTTVHEYQRRHCQVYLDANTYEW